MEIGKMQKALEYLNRAISIDPNNILANIQFGSYYLVNGDYKTARQYADKALQIDRNNQFAQMLSDKLNEKNNFETPQNNKKEMQKINNDINYDQNNYELNDININNENENENEINQNDEDNNDFNNLNSPEPETNSKEDPLNNEKYMINEITTDMENENENEEEYEENNK